MKKIALAMIVMSQFIMAGSSFADNGDWHARRKAAKAQCEQQNPLPDNGGAPASSTQKKARHKAVHDCVKAAMHAGAPTAPAAPTTPAGT
jgi:hypothetical protein